MKIINDQTLNDENILQRIDENSNKEDIEELYISTCNYIHAKNNWIDELLLSNKYKKLKKISIKKCQNIVLTMTDIHALRKKYNNIVEFDIDEVAYVSVVEPDNGMMIPELMFIDDIEELEKNAIILDGNDDGKCRIKGMIVLPNGYIAGGSGSTITIWDINEINVIHRLKEHTDRVQCLTNLSGNRMASGSCDTTIVIWDTITFKPITTLKGHSTTVRSLVYIPNGKLASGDHNGIIIIWDVVKYEKIGELKSLSGLDYDFVHSLAVHPNGILVSRSNCGFIRYWDVDKMERHRRLFRYSKVLIPSNCLAVLHNGLIASGLEDGNISICDTNVKGHSGYGGVLSLAVLPNGFLASSSNDKSVIIWNPNLNYGKLNQVIKLENFSISRSDFPLIILPNGYLMSTGRTVTKIWPLFKPVLPIITMSSSTTSALNLTDSEIKLHNFKQLLSRNQLTIDHIAKLFPKDHLKSFDFSNTLITDILFENILNHCESLIDIKINNCKWLTGKTKKYVQNLKIRIYDFYCSKSNIFISYDIREELIDFIQQSQCIYD